MKRTPTGLIVVLLLLACALLLALRLQGQGRKQIYVRLDDQSTVSLTTPYPGSDIDAVEILRGGDVIGTAMEVVAADIRNGATGNVNKFSDTDQMLGPPDYDQDNKDKFLALGGRGAHIVVRMSTDIRSGDTIRITEIGSGTGGSAEPSDVSISHSPVGPWDKIGTGAGTLELLVH